MSSRLKNLIMEGTTNRVSLQRLDAVLANVASKLSKKEQEKALSSTELRKQLLYLQEVSAAALQQKVKILKSLKISYIHSN